MKHPGVQKIIDVLEKVKSHEIERGFDMNGSHVPPEDECGSACCIGGHAAYQMGKLDLQIEEALAEFCSIPIKEAHLLCWPGDSRIPGAMTIYSTLTVDEAIEHLKWYRDTGIIDWSPYVKPEYQDDVY